VVTVGGMPVDLGYPASMDGKSVMKASLLDI